MRFYNHKMAFVAFLLLLEALSLSSCRHMVKLDDPSTIANNLSKIEAHNLKVEQLKATLDIRGHGFLGNFVHEEADVVVKAPDRLYWSLRSFFGSPALVIASNGQMVTIYNFLGDASPYQRISLKDESLFDLLDFRFHPQSIIYLLLSRIPLGTDIELKALGDELEISTNLEGGWQMNSLLDTAQGRVLKTKLFNPKEGVSYKATYKDFVEISGIYFPTTLKLQAKGRSKVADLNIHLTNIDLNGDPVSSKAFYLEPH